MKSTEVTIEQFFDITKIIYDAISEKLVETSLVKYNI